MRQYERMFLACLIVIVAMGGGCGNPEVKTVGSSLEVVFLPLADKINVPLDVKPAVYFSDSLLIDVDHQIDETNFFVESSDWVLTEGSLHCAALEDPTKEWEKVAGTLDFTKDRVVVFSPNGNTFTAKKCHRLTCTTAIKGQNQGNLLELPCRPGDASCRMGIGAEAIFYTVEQ